MKKRKRVRLYVAVGIVLTAVIFGNRGVSGRKAEYYKKIYDAVKDEYTMYGMFEGRNIAVYDDNNNKIRLLKFKDYIWHYRCTGFYKSDNTYFISVNKKSGFIFTDGDKINIEKYKSIQYLGENEYFYKIK
jgi:hypothetical protein